ncbi:hypothetical protein [Bacillus sp. KH172YL63]|uniref:hypothetical protein n=1 Tax=Bacillus sp. KH172YL63 TaxID=2709784 RepID=UPI0013E4B928|nr:hypothetical protein [Bacillus sp. KH172YL63]BCB03952.1 hypothetical protein KH172YL63_20850 [Bacillus sp. KH172YL63]
MVDARILSLHLESQWTRYFKLYLQLFEDSDKGRNGFAESVKSFLACWNSMCGKIAVESVFDHERMNSIYKELSTSIKENKRLRAALIYDAQTIAETSMVCSGFSAGSLSLSFKTSVTIKLKEVL